MEATTTQIAEALESLGVREHLLSAQQMASLDENGYTLLPNIISLHDIVRMRSRLDELAVIEGEAAGGEQHRERGTERIADLVNKDAVFDRCFTDAVILSAVSRVLCGDLKLSSLSSRTALPGCGGQALHVDYQNGAVSSGEYRVCNTMWLLDDFTIENGATRLVPGSHCSGKLPGDEMIDASQPHPREVLLIASAGSVLIFNAHTWHGGTANRTQNKRHVVHAYFCRRGEKQLTDQRQLMRAETLKRLGMAARCILEV